MKKIYIRYNEKGKQWELFHQDINETILGCKSLYKLCQLATDLGQLIQPAEILFTPRYSEIQYKIADFKKE